MYRLGLVHKAEILVEGERAQIEIQKKRISFKKIQYHSNVTIPLIDKTLKTLGSGDIKSAVRLLPGENLNDWLASNTIDFFNELALIWGIVVDVIKGFPQPAFGEGFPPGFEYQWIDGKSSAPIQCNGVQYVEFVFDWAEKLINDPEVFPQEADIAYKRNYLHIQKHIYTRFFRIFAIIYTHYFSNLEKIGAEPHLNTSFKHFMFFIWEFNLVKEEEFGAIQDLTDMIRTKYWNAPSAPEPVVPTLFENQTEEEERERERLKQAIQVLIDEERRAHQEREKKREIEKKKKMEEKKRLREERKTDSAQQQPPMGSNPEEGLRVGSGEMQIGLEGPLTDNIETYVAEEGRTSALSSPSLILDQDGPENVRKHTPSPSLPSLLDFPSIFTFTSSQKFPEVKREYFPGVHPTSSSRSSTKNSIRGSVPPVSSVDLALLAEREWPLPTSSQASIRMGFNLFTDSRSLVRVSCSSGAFLFQGVHSTLAVSGMLKAKFSQACKAVIVGSSVFEWRRGAAASGWMVKWPMKSQKFGLPTRRFFILRNDLLSYHEDVPTTSSISHSALSSLHLTRTSFVQLDQNYLGVYIKVETPIDTLYFRPAENNQKRQIQQQQQQQQQRLLETLEEEEERWIKELSFAKDDLHRVPLFETKPRFEWTWNHESNLFTCLAVDVHALSPSPCPSPSISHFLNPVSMATGSHPLNDKLSFVYSALFQLKKTNRPPMPTPMPPPPAPLDPPTPVCPLWMGRMSERGSIGSLVHPPTQNQTEGLSYSVEIGTSEDQKRQFEVLSVNGTPCLPAPLTHTFVLRNIVIMGGECGFLGVGHQIFPDSVSPTLRLVPLPRTHPSLASITCIAPFGSNSDMFVVGDNMGGLSVWKVHFQSTACSPLSPLGAPLRDTTSPHTQVSGQLSVSSTRVTEKELLLSVDINKDFPFGSSGTLRSVDLVCYFNISNLQLLGLNECSGSMGGWEEIAAHLMDYGDGGRGRVGGEGGVSQIQDPSDRDSGKPKETSAQAETETETEGSKNINEEDIEHKDSDSDRERDSIHFLSSVSSDILPQPFLFIGTFSRLLILTHTALSPLSPSYPSSPFSFLLFREIDKVSPQSRAVFCVHTSISPKIFSSSHLPFIPISPSTLESSSSPSAPHPAPRAPSPTLDGPGSPEPNDEPVFTIWKLVQNIIDCAAISTSFSSTSTESSCEGTIYRYDYPYHLFSSMFKNI